MLEFYRNQTKATTSWEYSADNSKLSVASGNSQIKALVALFLLLTTFFLGSCGGLMEEGVPNGYGRITINVPSSREISADEIAQMTYKFYFNGEDYGSQNTAIFPVGSSLTIKIEGYVEGILRASKTDSTFIVQAGDNYRNIMLSRSADEVIPPKVGNTLIYRYGEADICGNKTGLPSDSGSVIETGETFTVDSGDDMGWVHGRFDGWICDVNLEGDDNSGTSGVLAGQNVPPGTYIMPSGGVTLTAQWDFNSYTIQYNTDIPTGGDSGTPQVNAQGADSFTMASDDNGDALSTYTDGQGNWAFGGWSTTNGGAVNINSKADIRTAVAKETLEITSNNSAGEVTLYAVWTDARTPFTATVDASALGLGNTTIPNVMNGNNITTQVSDFLTGQSNSAVKYELKSGNTITANAAQPTVMLSDTNVTTKVELQLANKIITATDNSPLEQSEVTFTDPGTLDDGGLTTWYEVGTALPTATPSGSNAQQYAVDSGWRSTDSQVAHTTVSKDIAGKTLYPIGKAAFSVQVRFYNSNIGNAFYAFDGDDITNQIKNVVDNAGNLDNDNRRYVWNDAGLPAIIASSNTTRTYDVDSSSNNRLKVTAVQLTLYAQATESSGNSLIDDSGLTVTTNASADGWYNLNANLPTASLSGSSAAQYVLESGWRVITGTAQTTVTEDMAGETLYPIVRRVTMYTVTVKHFKVEGGDQYEDIDPADYSITTQNLPASVPAGSTISTTRSSDTITISITPGGSGTPDNYSFTESSGWMTANGCYISTTNNNGTLDILMGDEGDISSYTVNEDIYLGIYWAL